MRRLLLAAAALASASCPSLAMLMLQPQVPPAVLAPPSVSATYLVPGGDLYDNTSTTGGVLMPGAGTWVSE